MFGMVNEGKQFFVKFVKSDLKRKNVYSCRLPVYDIFSFQVIHEKLFTFITNKTEIFCRDTHNSFVV